MMTCRHVLYGGVAAAALASGAHAGDLSALKAELAALQTRVNQLEANPTAPELPEGASWLTFHRGSEAVAGWQTDSRRDQLPSDRGFTLAITPAADMPAPVTTVTVGGYVKGDVIYDFDQDLGDSFSYSSITDDLQTENHVRLHARQSRFNIKSLTDTAVGQIRTLIEVDFFEGGPFGPQTPRPRLRHAWGEWDFWPGWTLGAGQTWSNVFPPSTGVVTLDNNGPAGLGDLTRVAQVRVTYTSGPWRFATSIEEPTCEGRSKGERDCRVTIDNDVSPVIRGRPSNKIPDITAKVAYHHPDGHKFGVGGLTRFFNTDGDPEGVLFDTAEVSEQATGWVVMGGALLAVHEAVQLTFWGAYGDGAGNNINGLGNPAAWQASDGDVNTIKGLGLMAGATFTINDAWSANVAWGYANPDDDDVKRCMEEIEGAIGSFCATEGNTRELHSIHANLIWNPVKQLQMGWEIMWAKRDVFDFDEDDDSFERESAQAVRFQFATWFYF